MKVIEPTQVSAVIPGWEFIVYAKNQPRYRQLPAMRSSRRAGAVVSTWKLSWRERWRALVSGRLHLVMLTHHQRLQPILPSIDPPLLMSGGVYSLGR